MTTKAEIDMSPRAIEGRLEALRALYKRMVHLKQARTDLAQPVASTRR